MAAPFKVVVKGDKELERAFKKLRKDVLRELRSALRKAAEPVRAEAASLFSSYDPRSAGGYKIRVRQRGVAVQQTIGRTTGLRPDFGSLQMRSALLPALKDKQEEVVTAVNLMIDGAEAKAGLF